MDKIPAGFNKRKTISFSRHAILRRKERTGLLPSHIRLIVDQRYLLGTIGKFSYYNDGIYTVVLRKAHGKKEVVTIFDQDSISAKDYFARKANLK